MYRPDRIKEKGMSGFLLLDPAVSIVREKANPAISLNPISGKQELTFIGTLWEGNNDGWEVKKEFEGIKKGLVPVSKYISAKYLTNPNWVSEKNLVNNTAIFHYSGHCDFDKSGKAYMVPEVPASGQIELCKKVFTDNVAGKFNPDKTRLIVLSACNSGFSAVVKRKAQLNFVLNYMSHLQ
jgi:CHAT domain-containing protein